MGFVLDSIVRKIILEGPESVASDWESPSTPIDNIEQGFSIEFIYNSGNNVDMKVYLSFSNNDLDYAIDSASEVSISDNSGSVLFDVAQSATLFCKVVVLVNEGDITVDSIALSGKRRH